MWSGFRNARRCGSGSRWRTRSWSVRSSGSPEAARSCISGYSMTNPAFPEVSFTRVTAWQETQASPALAAGRSTISASGRSISPEKRTAWSWQPAHHLDGVTPTTLCMYSMDLRYQGLLNEANRCADSAHWSVMSAWHRAQVSLSRKKSSGIKPPWEVSAALGKNGPSAPPIASPAIAAGGRPAFSTGPGEGRLSRRTPPAGIETATSSGASRMRRRASSAARPAAAARCAHRSGRVAGVAPKTRSPRPVVRRAPPDRRKSGRSGSARSAGPTVRQAQIASFSAPIPSSGCSRICAAWKRLASSAASR